MSIKVQWQILPTEHLGLAAIQTFYSRCHIFILFMCFKTKSVFVSIQSYIQSDTSYKTVISWIQT
ncbi:hypothetical protein NC652_011314 [Populus alba x Populus x berolinensis]|nr:hypothetical protein NC652_011314 [Populus alba x Populus x berolinensis]